MAIPGRKGTRLSGNRTQNQINAKIDRYERLKEFEETLLPCIREDLKNGLSAEKILKKYEGHAAAALVTSLANPMQAQSAAEKILDRTQGKPTQKTETTHRFERLPEDQLDAMLKSGLASLDDDDKTTEGDSH